MADYSKIGDLIMEIRNTFWMIKRKMINLSIVTSRMGSMYRSVSVSLCPQFENEVQYETDESAT